MPLVCAWPWLWYTLLPVLWCCLQYACLLLPPSLMLLGIAVPLLWLLHLLLLLVQHLLGGPLLQPGAPAVTYMKMCYAEALCCLHAWVPLANFQATTGVVMVTACESCGC